MQKKRIKEILNTTTGNFMLFRRDIVNYILKIIVLVNRPDIKCSIIKVALLQWHRMRNYLRFWDKVLQNSWKMCRHLTSSSCKWKAWN